MSSSTGSPARSRVPAEADTPVLRKLMAFRVRF